MASDLEKITPPRELSIDEKDTVFEYFFRRLAAFRNVCEIYALTECDLSELPSEVKEKRSDQVIKALNQWAQDLLEKAWVVCRESGDDDGGEDIMFLLGLGKLMGLRSQQEHAQQ